MDPEVEQHIDDAEHHIIEAARSLFTVLRWFGNRPTVEVSTEEEYFDRTAMAKLLGVSLVTLDRRVAEGMPYVRVGDHKRFLPSDVRAWLRGRSEGNGNGLKMAG